MIRFLGDCQTHTHKKQDRKLKIKRWEIYFSRTSQFII